MSPSQAVAHHRLKLRMLLDLPSVANRSINPDLKAVQKMRSKWVEKHFGETTDASVLDAVRRYSSRHKNDRIGCNELEGGYCIVLVTEFMLRIHRYHQASKEVAFVYSTSCIERLNCCLTVMVCPSVAGGLPLAVILTSGQLKKQEYAAAFKLLQQILGTDSFFKQGYPSSFLTDDSNDVREALATVWPNSKLYLSVFHILQASWRWLWNAKNNVRACDRKTLINIMKRLVYASSKESFENELDNMKKNPLLIQYGNVAQYVS